MRLSMIFELLLIFVLLAFAASKHVGKVPAKGLTQSKRKNEKQESNDINKYCKCKEAFCNCCRDFQVPIVNLNGPGCASLHYLRNNKMQVSLSFGNRVLTNRTLSGDKPKPVCMPIPGGVSKFCGRVYNIAKKGEDFRACLGLELQSKDIIEAAVRVSCFKFGAKGVNSEPADPLPLAPEQTEDEDDDDDDDETFDLTDDDDDDDVAAFDDDDEDDEEAEDDGDADSDAADYGGFSLIGDDLLGGLFGSSEDKKKPSKKKQIALQPSSSTTKRPRTRRTPTTKRPTTPRVTRTTTTRRPTSPRTSRPTRTRTTRTRRTRTTTTPPPTSLEILTPEDETEILENEIPTSPKPIQNNILEKLEDSSENLLEPVVIVTQKPTKRPQSNVITYTTQKTNHVTNIDPGIQLSLADITGQLSEMPVTTIVSTSKAYHRGEFSGENQNQAPLLMEATTRKHTTPLIFSSSVEDDMIEVVESFDDDNRNEKADEIGGDSSASETQVLIDPVNEAAATDELQSSEVNENMSVRHSKKHKRNKNKKKKEEDDDDDDLYGLSIITDTLGLTSAKKKSHKNSKEKLEGSTTVKNLQKEEEEDDDDDFLGLSALTETLGLRSHKKKDKKNRTRQNKMMKDDWMGLEKLV